MIINHKGHKVFSQRAQRRELVCFMFQKIKIFIDKYRLLQKNDTVLVAISGGSDSVFLLHTLLKLKNLYKIKLFACHIDHQLRKESHKDARFVGNLCSKFGIPLTIEKVMFVRFSEEKARNLRYNILEKVAKKFGCNKIATGHTLNDNSETVLMWLARGCGLNGLEGIPPLREQIIRPILCISKKEIVSYLKKKKIMFCTDKTNFSEKFTRNRIRLNVIPQLEAINPKAIRNIFNLSERIRNNFVRNCVQPIDTLSKKYYNKKVGFAVREKTVYFDAAKIDIKKIKIRKWRFGDRMVPFGTTASKKLQDIFTDSKVPRNIRKEIPIVCEGKKIFWVAGVKRSNDARVTNDTKEIIKMECKGREAERQRGREEERKC